MEKIRVFHFLNSGGGGVLSVVRNLLLYKQHSLIENHIIYTINKDIVPSFEAIQLEGAASEQIFYYSAKWNFYYTCRQLAKLLPDDKAVVVAHDWLELGMMSNLGLQNPVIHFLHGDYDYYYNLSTKHAASIDLFFPVAGNIAQKLINLLPYRQQDISYLRFPVASITGERIEGQGVFNIIFIGRTTEAKGYNLLPVIANQLVHLSTDICWHIVGDNDKTKKEDWSKINNVKFYGSLDNENVLNLLLQMHVLLLPSLSEGMPIVVIEAMKAGVIPLVNDIEGGVQEMVINNETGWKIKGNKVESYVQQLILLLNDSKLMKQMQKKCTTTSNEMFNPEKNVEAIEERILTSVEKQQIKKTANKIYGSRLDREWMPNFFTTSFRKLTK